MGRAAQTTARWKSRKAGVRALRYIFSCVLSHAGFPTPDKRSRNHGPFLTFDFCVLTFAL